MWERKTDKAKWNGNVLNIQSTTLDGGKRLHVAELPHVDLPHIKVMGAKAKTVSIEVVFVGPNSLDDANNTILELDNNPEGTLEHPWLGELSLVFETSSQSFSTKKGLVTLSLKFYRQGELSAAVNVDTKTINTLVSDVSLSSKPLFLSEIKQASPNGINAMKFQFNNAFNSLRNIANRSTNSSEKLNLLHRQINAGVSSIENMVSDPASVSDNYFVTINTLNDVITETETSTASTNSIEQGLLSVRNVASQSIRDTINSEADSFHYNLHATYAAVILSKDLETLNAIEKITIETLDGQQLDEAARNVSVIINQLDERINEVSSAANFENLVLVEAVELLRENVREQNSKIINFKNSLKEHDVPVPRPLFCIAQSLESSREELSSINNIKHPLFVSGKVKVTTNA